MSISPYAAPPDWKLEGLLFWKFLKHRVLVGILFGALLFGITLYSLLRSMPRVYTASVSVSMQGSSGISSTLGALLGANTASHSYLGVLHSRRLARDVEHLIHLQQYLKLSTENEAIGRIAGSIKVEDVQADGLLYITINLSAPPRLGSDTTQDIKIRKATAMIANAYPQALLQYMRDSDTDKDLSLLRAAEKELRRVRGDYYEASNRLLDYVRKHPVTTTQESAEQSGDKSDSTAGSGLQALYQRRGQLEQEMAYADALHKGTLDRIKGDAATIPDLPNSTELTEARRYYNETVAALEDLQIQLDDQNPRVVAAAKRMKVAEKRLLKQVTAIRNGKTSEAAKREAMEAEMQAVQNQLRLATRSMQAGRESDLTFSDVKREMELRFEILKQAIVQYAGLSLQTVSAQNRLVIIDEAVAPTESKPAVSMLRLLSLMLALVGTSSSLLLEYLVRHKWHWIGNK